MRLDRNKDVFQKGLERAIEGNPKDFFIFLKTQVKVLSTSDAGFAFFEKRDAFFEDKKWQGTVDESNLNFKILRVRTGGARFFIKGTVNSNNDGAFFMLKIRERLVTQLLAVMGGFLTFAIPFYIEEFQELIPIGIPPLIALVITLILNPAILGKIEMAGTEKRFGKLIDEYNSHVRKNKEDLAYRARRWGVTPQQS